MDWEYFGIEWEVIIMDIEQNRFNYTPEAQRHLDIYRADPSADNERSLGYMGFRKVDFLNVRMEGLSKEEQQELLELVRSGGLKDISFREAEALRVSRGLKDSGAEIPDSKLYNDTGDVDFV